MTDIKFYARFSQYIQRFDEDEEDNLIISFYPVLYFENGVGMIPSLRYLELKKFVTSINSDECQRRMGGFESYVLASKVHIEVLEHKKYYKGNPNIEIIQYDL